MRKTSSESKTNYEELEPKYNSIGDSEVYVDIPGYEKYQVSNIGNVRSKDYHYTCVSSGIVKKCFHKGRVLWKEKGKRGYLHVRIGSSPNWKRIGIHRLVCAGFLGLNLKDPKQFACHKNDIPYDNRVENLFVGDAKINVADMRSKGRCTIDNSGEKNGMSKLTEYDVKNIRLMRSEGTSRLVLASIYGIHRDYVSKLTGNGKSNRWSFLGKT